MESARSFQHELDLPFACVVADGMGGHNDGEQASLLVARSLARRLPAFESEKIAASVRAVNAELYAHVGENPALAGMGSTVVGLAQLSVDDSFVQNWKPGAAFARSSMLTQCFGGRPTFTDIQPHMHVEPCVPGSTHLLCCDGLYETLPEEQIFSLIGADVQASVEALLRTALEQKAKDNVTIALVRVLG
ncbi:MAG: serine/threonine-protein phosphatase [Betaproteobacteria bacterium]|nr:serine/threonine-protein phosphatase [Betaproteobacteria bacterium]